MEPMLGKRLLIAEELKRTMKLDESGLKNYSGGSGVVIEGRKCDSSEMFKFVWHHPGSQRRRLPRV